MMMLDDYELLRRLGSGGMGEVWSARKLGDVAGKIVAIKKLPDHHADDPLYRKMFRDEVRLTALLSYAKIVHVFESGYAKSGTLYMVMEYVHGLDLGRLNDMMRINEQLMPLPIAVHILGEVLHALAYLQEWRYRGKLETIVHRDATPQNVMLSVSGEVKLMDFGVARRTSEETSGGLKGKLRYMSPEQMLGKAGDPTVDLFAVGVMFHELVSGTKYRAEFRDFKDLTAKARAETVAPLDNIELPPELERVRTSLLAHAASERPASARAAIELLREWPGYTNKSLELAELVSSFVGSDYPQAGLSMTRAVLRDDAGHDDTALEADTALEGSMPTPMPLARPVPDERRRAQLERELERLRRANEEQLELDDDQSSPSGPRAGESTETQPTGTSVVVVGTRRWFEQLALLLAGVAGAIVIIVACVLGLARLLATSGEQDSPPPSPAPVADEPASIEAELEATEPAREQASSGPVPEPVPEPDREEVEPAVVDSPRARPVELHVMSCDFARAAIVSIDGGRERHAESTADYVVKQGRHKLRARPYDHRAQADWDLDVWITVPAGKCYEVCLHPSPTKPSIEPC